VRDALAHEQRLTGEIDVVGAGVDASIDEPEPCTAVGTDRRGHHAGPACHRGERLGVTRVRDHERPLPRSRGQIPAHPGELLLRAARQPDAHAVRRVLGQVRGNQPTDEAGGPEHGDVECPVSPHP
jgi:hypothetical protein